MATEKNIFSTVCSIQAPTLIVATGFRSVTAISSKSRHCVQELDHLEKHLSEQNTWQRNIPPHHQLVLIIFQEEPS